MPSMQILSRATENFTNKKDLDETQPPNLLKRVFDKLENYLADLKKNKNTLSAEEHEATIARLTFAIGRTAIGDMLSHFDESSTEITVEEKNYRLKHKAKKVYQTSLGPIEIVRHVYQNRRKNTDGKSICPLELKAGIVEGYWSAKAAKHSAWLLAHLTPQETETALLELGLMNPSRSSLDRLPKALLQEWDKDIVTHQKSLTELEAIPDEAVSMATSLDGVMVGMKPDKTTQNKASEWREASCGSVSFFDKDGKRLQTTQYGRMPEHKKKCLKNLLREHTELALKSRPNLTLLHIADGAQDNWCFFDEEMPVGFQLTDYYHACQYLKKAFDAAYPKAPSKAKEKYDNCKAILRDNNKGIKTVLRALRYLKQKNKSNDEIKTAVTYFANNQHRMNYADAKEKNLPIGSGIIEATCKSLVSQRMKRSGMSWNLLGGQSILTLRSLVKSNRFDKAWPSITRQYKKEVKSHQNVVSLFG